MQKITLDNRDTENIHIDTYGMLTGENYDEMTLEYERDEKNNPELNYDSFDWTYEHPAIVKDFAAASIEILEQVISNTNYAKIITGIQYLASGSPTYYNYTTDWYTAEYTVDETALDAYIQANYEEIEKIVQRYDDCNATGKEYAELLNHAAVCHILNNCMTADDYNIALWEKEYEVYSENTTLTLIKQEPNATPSTPQFYQE